jgi:deazaflavin-dependent oxidoreductase (nitroreductase family)
VKGVRRALISAGTRLFNPLTKRFAGSRTFPLFALVRHRGRRSGRVYATPVGARPTADGFVIPLTFGTSADWYRNVQAAGACVIRWRGAEYPMVEPMVVEWANARSAFSRLEYIAVPLLGITEFVRLRHAHAPESDHV